MKLKILVASLLLVILSGSNSFAQVQVVSCPGSANFDLDTLIIEYECLTSVRCPVRVKSYVTSLPSGFSFGSINSIPTAKGSTEQARLDSAANGAAMDAVTYGAAPLADQWDQISAQMDQAQCANCNGAQCNKHETDTVEFRVAYNPSISKDRAYVEVRISRAVHCLPPSIDSDSVCIENDEEDLF